MNSPQLIWILWRLPSLGNDGVTEGLNAREHICGDVTNQFIAKLPEIYQIYLNPYAAGS